MLNAISQLKVDLIYTVLVNRVCLLCWKGRFMVRSLPRHEGLLKIVIIHNYI